MGTGVGDVGWDEFDYYCYWVWDECHFYCVCMHKIDMWEAPRGRVAADVRN